MTPDLIAQVLALPLPVRLALLDADPTGAGWYVSRHGASMPISRAETYAPSLRSNIEDNDSAWLPCNPLAIVEHAGTFAVPDGTKHVRSGIAATHPTRAYTAWLIYMDDGGEKGGSRDSDAHPCPHTAAIALLREVVG